MFDFRREQQFDFFFFIIIFFLYCGFSFMSQSRHSVHSGAKERNSAALLSGQPHHAPSVTKEQTQPPSASNSKQSPRATAVGVQVPSQARALAVPQTRNTRRSSCGCRTTRNNPKGHVVAFTPSKTLQSDSSLVQNHQHSCLLSVFCFRSAAVKCRSVPPPPRSPQVIKKKKHTVMVFGD